MLASAGAVTFLQSNQCSTSGITTGMHVRRYDASADGSVVATRLGRIGLLICADTFLDPVVEQLAAQEPDLVVVPYGWAAPAADWPEHGESLRAWVAHTARRCRAPRSTRSSTLPA